MSDEELEILVRGLATINDDDMPEVYASLKELGPRAVPYLIPTIANSDSDLLLRRRAGMAAFDIKDERLIEPLIAALDDPDFGVQGIAAGALGKMGLLAFPALISQLENPKPYIRRLVVGALGMIQDESVLEPIATALEDQDTEVRLHAAYTLGRIGDDTVLYALRSVALYDQKDEIKEIAKHSMAQIKNNWKASQKA